MMPSFTATTGIDVLSGNYGTGGLSDGAPDYGVGAMMTAKFYENPGGWPFWLAANLL